MRTSIVFVALICVASAAGQDLVPPRQTFEKAAYAEEHERDFEKAMRLYREAVKAADKAGDRALVAEAAKGIERLEARMGKGTDTRARQDIPIAVQRRLFLLVKQLSAPRGEGEHSNDNKNYEAQNQLTQFGAVAVPILERALNSEVIEDPDDEQASNKKSSGGGFRGSTHWAGRALAAMEAPEAAAALARGLRSPDPFVRTTVVSNAFAARHRALLDDAVKEPTLAGLAIKRLSYAKDADLGDLMKSAVYRDDQGGPAAMKWLVRNRRDEAVAAAKTGKIRAEALKAALEEIVGDGEPTGRGGNMPRSSVEIESKLPVLLEIGEAIQEPTHVLILIEQVNRLLGSSSQFDPTLKSRLEAIALRTLPEAIKENSSETIMRLLGNIGGLPTARTLLSSGKGPVEDTSYQSIRRIVARAPSTQFLEAAEIVREMAARSDKALSKQTLNDFYIQLRIPAKGASADDLIAGWKAAPEDQRSLYVDNVVFFQDQKPPLKAIVTLLEIGDEGVRRKALDWLGNKGAEEGALAAIAKALSDPSEFVRNSAQGAFNNSGYHDPKQAAALLAAAVKEHESDPSPQLVASLGWLPKEESFPILKRLWTAAPGRRGAIADKLLDMGGGDEVSAFLVENFNDIPEAQRSKAIERFGLSVYEPAIDVIGSQLASRNEEVRQRAQAALDVFKKQREAVEEFNRWKTGGAESRASTGELMKLLESQNREVVIRAVKALGAIRAQSALPALVKLINRNDSAINEAVDEAIKKIGE